MVFFKPFLKVCLGFHLRSLRIFLASIAYLKKPKDLSEIGKINNIHPSVIAVDDFYKNPDEVREYALTLNFQHNKQQHKGQRTRERVFFDGTKEFFEDILKKKVTSWDNQPHNGVFQFCTAEDQLVYHTDAQTYAAVVFLTPNAPAECGTSFFRHIGLSCNFGYYTGDCGL